MAPIFTSLKARGSSTCTLFSCRLSRWDMTDRSSFHTVIGRVGKSEKFKSSGISSLRFHNQARFNIRSHLFVCLFIYLFIFGCTKNCGKNRLRCRFSPCDSMFFRFVYSAHSVSARECVHARAFVCVWQPVVQRRRVAHSPSVNCFFSAGRCCAVAPLAVWRKPFRSNEFVGVWGSRTVRALGH